MIKTSPQAIQDILNILAETPERFAAASQGLTLEQLHHQPDSKSWSMNDILAHLRACADVWGLDIQRMLVDETPTLPAVHPRTRLQETDYPTLNFQVSLNAFTEQRKSLLNTLKGLNSGNWSRSALIGGRTQTVFSQARRIALHEQGHWEQIQETAQQVA